MVALLPEGRTTVLQQYDCDAGDLPSAALNQIVQSLIPDKENYDKHYLESIIEWWKKKAQSRYDNLKTEGRLRSEIEVWTGDKELDIIR